jgi:hypothetical protein
MWAETPVGFHVKCPLFLSDFNQISNVRIFLVQFFHTKSHENPLVVHWWFASGNMDVTKCNLEIFICNMSKVVNDEEKLI